MEWTLLGLEPAVSLTLQEGLDPAVVNAEASTEAAGHRRTQWFSPAPRLTRTVRTARRDCTRALSWTKQSCRFGESATRSHPTPQPSPHATNWFGEPRCQCSYLKGQPLENPFICRFPLAPPPEGSGESGASFHFFGFLPATGLSYTWDWTLQPMHLLDNSCISEWRRKGKKQPAQQPLPRFPPPSV